MPRIYSLYIIQQAKLTASLKITANNDTACVKIRIYRSTCCNLYIVGNWKMLSEAVEINKSDSLVFQLT